MILLFRDIFYRRSEVYLYLLVVAAGSATICSTTATDSWYIGCYRLLSENLGNSSENVTILGMAGNPVICGRQCLELRFTFTAIYSNRCLCFQNLPSETSKLSRTSCNLTCAYNASAFVASESDGGTLVQHLPCGGSAAAMSVYTSAGPYLHSLSVFVADSTIRVNQAFVLSIVFNFAGRPDMPLGFEVPATVLSSAVYVEATCAAVDSSPLIAKTKTEQINTICIISTEGYHTANATVSNIFSEISSSVSVEILASVISCLDVTSLPDEVLLPSCLPELETDNDTSQQVFEGILTKFEASVDVSSNDIVFDWFFVDSFGAIVFNISRNGSACHNGQSCTVCNLEYRFQSAGTYSIYVNASNDRSVASDQMQLMVVSPGVQNVTLAVETSVGVLGEKVNILVSLVASLLPKTVVVIGFGDGTVRHVGFRCRDQACQGNGGDGPAEGSVPEDEGLSETVTSFSLVTAASSLPTAAAEDPNWANLEIMETYGYTSDCQLLVEISHTYVEEGIFQPTVSAGDSFGNVSVSLSGFLVIANKLHSVVILGHELTEAVGHNVSFRAVTEAPSVFVSYFWQISKYDSSVILELQTNDSILIYMFLEPGQYEIEVNASNPVDSVSIRSLIFIEAHVQNLQISCSPFKYVAVYQQINCSATLDSGSSVDFRWSFQNASSSWTRIRNQDLMSNAIHYFYSLGSYSVSVNASNAISWLSGSLPYSVVVMESVYNLWTRLPPPVLLGSLVTFEATAEAGVSDFVLEFDFGYSSQRVVVNASTGVNISVSHEYARVGSYRAMVCARNEVSKMRKRFDVDIMEDIDNVSIAVTGPPPLLGTRTVFAAYVDGRLSDRADLVYKWSVDGDVFSVTQSPVAQFMFNDSSALYNVSVVVYNLVVLRSDWLMVNVTDASREAFFRFDQDVVTAVGLPTTFTLINLLPGRQLEVNYGDNSTEEIETTEADLRLEHTYAKPGLYEVWAECHVTANGSLTDAGVDDDVIVVRTAISVQRKLTNLSLSGPGILPMTSRSLEPSEWSAAVSNATNVVYVWKLDDVVSAVSAKNKEMYEVPSFGQHTVSVVAINGLGQLTANASLLLQNPVMSVSMEIEDVAFGAVTRIQIVVRGDRDFVVTWSFGDGTVQSNTTVESVATPSDPEDESSADEVPLYTTTVEHRYSSVGVFPVLVNVTNRVSWLTANETARVYEPIGDVVLTTDSPTLVPSGSVVMVTGITMANYNLTFNWKAQRSVCFSSSKYNGSFWQSRANCSLPRITGVHVVVVNVSSRLPDNWRIASVNFTCVDPVRDLVLASPSPNEAAVLKTNMTHVGNFYTDPVRFEASLSQGSDILCRFDFADNSSSAQNVVNGERLGSSSTTRCHTTHVFRKAGVYQVNVTAGNPISSLSGSMFFYVQVPPSGLRLAEPYRTRVGQDVVLSANLSAGTDVAFSWWLGNGQVLAGRTVTHRYASLGCYRESVVASNRVGSEKASANVYVQDFIQSVELVANLPMSSTGIIIRSGATVSFTANTHPNARCLVDGFLWRPQRDQKDSTDVTYQTIASDFSFFYHKVGTFSATVTAVNALSQLTSQPLIVTVLDEIQPITISIQGETITNNQIEFNAYHYRGSSVTYSWNFGDNTTANATTVSKVKHNYTTVGRFVVQVVARNAISQQTANRTIFVVLKICKPPVISLLGPPDVVYWRSEDIKVEANVFINCSITNATTYSWLVSSALTGATYDLRRFALHDPLLFLPKRSLPYGNYSVQLRVSMVNTIVYGEAELPYRFSVVQSPLQAVLHRGLKRKVSYSMNITLDGSKSWDPDFPEANDFVYSWTCSDFENRDRSNRSCFADPRVSEDVESHAGKILTLPGSKFIKHNMTSSFLFLLTISRPNRTNSSAQQLLIFEEKPVIDVFISCDDCADSLVNSNSRLVLQAVHAGYSEKDIVYEWKLSDIKTKDSRYHREPTIQESCIHPDEVTWNLVANGSALNSSGSSMDAMEQKSDDSRQPYVASTASSATAAAAELNTPEGKTMTMTLPSTLATPHKDSNSDGVTDSGPSSVSASSVNVPTQLAPEVAQGGAWIRPDEGNSGGGRSNPRRPGPPPLKDSNPGGGPLLPSTSSSTVVSSSSSSSAAQPLLPDFDKGFGESAGKGSRSEALPPLDSGNKPDPEEGKSAGRGAPHKGDAVPSSPKPPEEEKDKGDPAVDHRNINRDTNGILTTVPNERKLLPYETTTGVNESILIINPNVLSQGLLYIVQVIVRHQATNVSGMSMIAFRVNKSPGLGQCSLNANANKGGTEMQTQFIVYCRGWKDKDLPISYEASYRLSAELQPRPIYRGLNSQITFQLPAGDPNNYTVVVEVAVVDSLGARTPVCLSMLVIRPAAADEEILSAVVKDNSTLDTQIQMGHNDRARLTAQMVALQLNRLNDWQNETQSDLRKMIRSKLLCYVKDLPVRNMLEVHQSLSFLTEVTRVTEEIEIEGARFASFLLEQLSRQMIQLLVEINADDFPLVDLAIESVSNLLSSLLISERESYLAYETDIRSNLVMTSLDNIETLLTVKARQFTNQKTMKQPTAALSTFTGRFGVDCPSRPIVVFDRMTVTLPSLERISQQLLYTRDPDELLNRCFKLNVVLHKENPFLLQPRSSIAIKTDVVSATMYSCNESRLKIDNLPNDQAVDIWLPNRLHQDLGDVHVLTRELMTVHMFNLTSSDLQKDHLHIDIEFIPFHKPVRAFPVSILLQVDVEPSPSSYLFQWDLPVPVTTKSLVINPAALKIEGDRSFFLCLVDRNFNSLRPRPDQAKNMSYKLTVWWGQCVFWDATISDWSPVGCSLHNSSSFRDIRCQCNHMTSYGAHILVYPDEVRLMNLNHFFSLPLNPVTSSFFGSLLLIYFILLFIASKLDAHDNRKLTTVSLIDNSPKDRQKYYITLETGFRKGAGTTAKVSVVLHGEYGMSETRELISQAGQPLFERNSRDTFYMTFPESLGSIFKVQLWHDNSGPSPSWYLSRVTVKDACTGDIYYFVCEKWFAVEKEDGKVEREVMAADKGLGFSKILTAKSMQYLTDYHLWFSTVVKPSYSRFSRAQRLTCCLCLLMSYMALSTAWYQYVGPPYRGEFSLIDISWQSIIVGMIVSVIVLPPTVLIIIIFRRSKVYRSRFEEDLAEESDAKGYDRPLSSSEEEPSGLSVFEQTMLSWQSLQEWAQKAWAKRYQQSPIGSTQNVKPVTIQNVADQQQPSMNLVKEDQPQTEDQQQTKTADVQTTQAQRVAESAPECLKSGVEPNRQTSVESTCSSSCGAAEQRNMRNRVEAWDVKNIHLDVEEMVEARRAEEEEEEEECRAADGGGEEEANTGKEGKAEEKQQQQVAQVKCQMRSKQSSSSYNTSPSSSFFESSPKETRRPTTPVVEDPSDKCLASSAAAAAPLQPPSYGVIHRSDASSSSRYASSHGTPSNRSSVKSTCSAASTNCTKRTMSKKWRCFLPHCGVYIGWSLCALLITGCAAVTIYYGYRFSSAQSILWLQSVFFSFLQCIFITHPIIVLAIMLYSGIRYRNDMSIFDHYSDGLIMDKEPAQDSCSDSSHEKQKLSHSCIEAKTLAEGIAARQRSRYLRFARPPQEQRLIQARHQTMKETNASALVNETVLFVGQFLLLIFIAFGKETETSYQLKESLTKSFISNGGLPFENVTSVNDWWLWVNKHFLETIYSDEGYVDNCYLIGLVGLRQLRIRDEDCYIRPPSMNTVTPRCRALYDQAPHETNILMKNGIPYYFANSDKTGCGPIDGKFSSYGGGGYAVALNRSDRSKAAWQLSYLQESGWIDEHTSAVVIEFTLFHPQSNLFATISLLLEVPPLGIAFTSSRVAVVFLYKYITPMDNLVLACELLFFLATMLKIYHEIIQVLRHGINYLKNVWNVLEVSQCMLSLALIICYTYRFLLIDSLVEKFRSTYLEEFVDVSNLAYWDQVLRSVTGFVLLLVNLQLVKGLRHHQPFARFTNVYNHTSLDFVVFGCMFVIWLGAYVSLGIALFSGVLWEMTSVSQAVGYMTGLLECSYKFPQFKGLSPSEMTIWEIYTMTFLVLAYGSIAGYLLAFLTFHYKVFKDEPVLVFGPKESFVYYWHKARSLFIRKSDDAYNHQKQQDVVLPPEFTMAEIQYQVDEMLFKMNALAGTSNLPEKPTIYFTDSDTTCVGIGEDLSSNTGSSGEGNFEGWLKSMKENLFRNEPHFAQLVNSNSQSVVKKEADKQLILQLEMEILRQLQIKRSSNNHLSESGISPTNAPSGGGEEAGRAEGRGGGEGGGRGGGGGGAGARSSRSGCRSTSSTDSTTSAALCAHMSSAAAAQPLWRDEVKSALKEVACLGAMFATNEDGKDNGPSPMMSGYQSKYLMTHEPESNQRTSAANDLGAIQQSHPDGSVSRDSDSALELQVLSHLRSLADDDDEDENDACDCPHGLLSGDVMETEFGSDMIRRLLVPGRNRGGLYEGKWKRGRVPSWTSTASIESNASHTVDSREVATEVPAAVHLPSAPVAHLGRCENADEGFGLVEEDVFGFENEGYIIESSSEESDDDV